MSMGTCIFPLPGLQNDIIHDGGESGNTYQII